jgi:hypothetical protein
MTAGQMLLFRFGRRLCRLFRKRFHPFEFRLKSGCEIVRAVLEEHDEAEGKENEENEPKKPPEQRHGTDGNLLGSCGQRG